MKYLFLFLLGTPFAMAQPTLSISPANTALEHVLIEFDLPQGFSVTAAKDQEGHLYPIQRRDGRGAILLNQLSKGKEVKLSLIDDLATHEPVKVERAGKKVKVTERSKPLLEYQAEPGELPRDNIKPIFRRG